ncbi:MAG: hypothetical protein ABSC94_03065 [Polyangiaceae bacterium]|jgi:hypothetical protein
MAMGVGDPVGSGATLARWALLVLLAAGCSAHAPASPVASDHTSLDSGAAVPLAADGDASASGGGTLFVDGGPTLGPAFPPDPVGAGQITDAQAAALAASFSGAAPGSAPAPCLTEPTLGAMFPTNFTPPLFEWTADSTFDVFELRLHVDGEANDLLVYTDETTFQMPSASWSTLAAASAGQDIAVSLRAGTLTGGVAGGVVTGPNGVIHIAPVAAPGAVVYWTTSASSALKGFHIGDSSATTVLTPALMQQASPGQSATCIGCHVASPDGTVAFVDRQDEANGPFGIDARLVDGTGEQPGSSIVSNAALATLSLTYNVFPTLSLAHYSATDAVALSVRNVDVDGGSYDDTGSYELVWTDLHTGASGTMQRTGDPGQPDSPDFSHDGVTVAYTSTTGGPISIYETSATTDVYTVPYADRAGGGASPLAGASDPAYNEYFPAYSPGDTFVSFDRIGAGESVYGAPGAEVFVVPASGGAPTRLAANDPPQCTGVTSPGIGNSWPRWAPSSSPVGSKRYYWLVFSSTRRSPPGAPTPVPQLFLCAIVTLVNGTSEVVDSTYPAVYIPAQTPTESNHTPAWDQFQLPPPR